MCVGSRPPCVMGDGVTAKGTGHMTCPPQVGLPQWPAWHLNNASPRLSSPTGSANARSREDQTAKSGKPDCMGGRSWLTVRLSVPASLLTS